MEWVILDHLMTATMEKPDTVRTILARRGIRQPMDFLCPSLSQLRAPGALHGMHDAVSVALEAKREGHKICIYGDYDADGIDATTIMVLGFRAAGVDVDYYIPERHDGYGLSFEAMDKMIADGVDLLITCDTGITAKDEIAYFTQYGARKVIVTDHHTPQDNLPKCILINPQLADCQFGYRELSGSGVAWFFIHELHRYLGISKDRSYDLLPFVAIGTIADVMPLTEDNRILVKEGLARMSTTKNYGLRHLLAAAGLENKEITPHHVGFQIGPILNATGRLSHNKQGQSVSPSDAVDMFLDSSRLRTYRIAEELVELNQFRREITVDYVQIVKEEIEKNPIHRKSKIMVVPVPDLPEGIVGLIAGRLKEEYNRPILLMTNAEAGIHKGSGRSISKYNMFDHLSALPKFFEKFGGHSMACGFAIRDENIDPLRAVLNGMCPLKPEDFKIVREIDFAIDPSLVTLELAESLSELEPFGKGNARPLFGFMAAEVVSSGAIGKEKNHLTMKIDVEGYEFECIGFSMAQKFEDLGYPTYIDICFFPQVNTYNNRTRLQLKIEDFRESEVIEDV